MIWECSTKDDVISLWEEAGKPLDADILVDLEEVDADLMAEGLNRNFVILDAQCRICNYKSLIICPAICDLDNLECENCENKTMQERNIPEWEK